MMTVTFNTGRQYSAHGQRIVARLMEVPGYAFLRAIEFCDKDRNISGLILLAGAELEAITIWHPLDVKDAVMDAYDHNRYFPAGWNGDLTAPLEMRAVRWAIQSREARQEQKAGG